MKRLICEISIGELKTKFVQRFEIESTWDKFTDTAIVSLPRLIVYRKERKRIESLVKVNDAVTIKAGYLPNLETRFVGFVSKIEPNVVTKIHCQDGAWLCKQKAINFSGQNMTIKKLITDNFPAGLGTINAIDAAIGSLRIKNMTLSQILDKVRTTYGVRTWFKGLDIYSGLPYIQSDGKTHEISFQRDIPLDGSSLEYQDGENIKLKVKAISILPDNTKIETEVGDADGEQRTFTTYNVTSVSELKKLAEQHADDLKFTGFRGSFTMFGEPFVQHGDKIILTDELNPERGDGSTKYGVKSVRNEFDVTSGFRQIIELGQKSS
jgi:hypothetical protein